MFNSIFARLFITCVLVILIALLIVVTLSAYLIKSDYLASFSNEMDEVSAEIIKSFNLKTAGKISELRFLHECNSIANRENTAITILYSSNNSILILPDDYLGNINTTFSDESYQELVNATLDGEKGSTIFQEDSISNHPLVVYSTPILSSDDIVLGGVMIYKKLGELNILFQSMNKQFIASALFSFTIAFVLIWTIAKSITKPINGLTKSLKSIAKGDFSTRVDYKGEDEISYLANSFNQMATDLEKHEALRNSFVGNVSHELRTPMTAINGFVTGMLDGTIPKEEHPNFLNIVLSETRRLNSLITDLLELSKVDSGKFPINISSFDINELLRITLLSFEKRIDEKQLNIVIDFQADNIYVAADKDKITQVVSNLIDNAIKFNSVKGSLGLKVQLVRNKIEVKISNTGEPIAESDKELIFERFYKADQSHNRKIPGTGIGLSLVKKILAQHGEKIWIEDSNGTTAFCFTLKSAKDLKQ